MSIGPGLPASSPTPHPVAPVVPVVPAVGPVVPRAPAPVAPTIAPPRELHALVRRRLLWQRPDESVPRLLGAVQESVARDGSDRGGWHGEDGARHHDAARAGLEEGEEPGLVPGSREVPRIVHRGVLRNRA